LQSSTDFDFVLDDLLDLIFAAFMLSQCGLFLMWGVEMLNVLVIHSMQLSSDVSERLNCI